MSKRADIEKLRLQMEAGDESARGKLYLELQRFGNWILQRVIFYDQMRREQVVDDFLEEFLLAPEPKIQNVKTDLLDYFKKCLINAAKDRKREVAAIPMDLWQPLTRREFVASLFEDDELQPEAAAQFGDDGEQAAAVEHRIDCAQRFSKLSDRNQDIVRLLHQGYEYAEVCSQLEMSPAALEKAVYRLRKAGVCE